MDPPSYTTCVKASDYEDPGFPSGGFFKSLWMVIEQGGFDLLLRICDYMLHGKLVCLGGDECAIGRVASFETVADKSGFDKIDNDFCINLALCPDPLSNLKAGKANRVSNYTAAVGGKQGPLIVEKPGMPAPREGGANDERPSATYAGTFVKIHSFLSLQNPIPEDIANEDDATTWHLPVLHTEIEGNRVRFVCTAANVLWGPVHKTVCKIPWIGGFICTVLTVLLSPFIAIALAILGAAWAAGSSDHRDFDGGGDLKADDLVLIRGRFVYDAGHAGWNELHPVKRIQKIPDAAACLSNNFDALRARWCTASADIWDSPGGVGGWHPPPGMVGPPPGNSARQQATWHAQTQPENRWLFHPLVDGCDPQAEPPPIIK